MKPCLLRRSSIAATVIGTSGSASRMRASPSGAAMIPASEMFRAPAARSAREGRDDGPARRDHHVQHQDVVASELGGQAVEVGARRSVASSRAMPRKPTRVSSGSSVERRREHRQPGPQDRHHGDAPSGHALDGLGEGRRTASSRASSSCERGGEHERGQDLATSGGTPANRCWRRGGSPRWFPARGPVSARGSRAGTGGAYLRTARPRSRGPPGEVDPEGRGARGRLGVVATALTSAIGALVGTTI